MTPFQKLLMFLGGFTLVFLAMMVILGLIVFFFCVYCEIQDRIDKRKTRHLAE